MDHNLIELAFKIAMIAIAILILGLIVISIRYLMVKLKNKNIRDWGKVLGGDREKARELGRRWGENLTHKTESAISSEEFNKSKSSILVGALIGAFISTFVFCIHNRDVKLDIFDFSFIQLVLIGLLTLTGTGFFYDYQNKNLRYFCSQRSILFWAAFILLGDGFEIFNTKTVYYRYYRQHGISAQIFGLVEMFLGIYSIYLGLSFDKIKEKLKRV